MTVAHQHHIHLILLTMCHCATLNHAFAKKVVITDVTGCSSYHKEMRESVTVEGMCVCFVYCAALFSWVQIFVFNVSSGQNYTHAITKNLLCSNYALYINRVAKILFSKNKKVQQN